VLIGPNAKRAGKEKKAVRAATFDQFTLCTAHDLLKRSLTFIAFFSPSIEAQVQGERFRVKLKRWTHLPAAKFNFQERAISQITA
jgi:hypothetical protein